MRLFGAFVGFAAAQTTETSDLYTDWFDTAYDWLGIFNDNYASEYDNSYSYMYNLGDFYNFDYSYLFDNSTEYDSLIPTWDYRTVFNLFVHLNFPLNCFLIYGPYYMVHIIWYWVVS